MQSSHAVAGQFVPEMVAGNSAASDFSLDLSQPAVNLPLLALDLGACYLILLGLTCRTGCKPNLRNLVNYSTGADISIRCRAISAFSPATTPFQKPPAPKFGGFKDKPTELHRVDVYGVKLANAEYPRPQPPAADAHMHARYVSICRQSRPQFSNPRHSPSI